MTKPLSAVLILCCVIGVAACSSAVSPATATATALRSMTVFDITLTPFRAAIVGQAVSTLTNPPIPLAATIVRLAQVFWNEGHSDGAYVLEGARSPSTISDDNGFFAFANISPGDYVVVIGDVNGQYEIVSDANAKAIIYTVAADSTLDVGTLAAAISTQGP